jgi:hypothetical protein
MAITPNANLSTTYVDILADGTTELLMGKIAVGSLVADSVGDMNGEFGNTVRYHRAPKGTVQNASDGSSKTYATTAGSTDELVLNYFKEVPFEAGDLDYTIANPEHAVSQYGPSAALQLANQINTDVLEEFLDDSNIGDATVVGAEDVDLNEEAMAEVMQTFIEFGIDPSEVVILLNPKHSKDLVLTDVFRNADYIGENDARAVQINGRLPKDIYGMAVYTGIQGLPVTNDVPSISGSSSTLKVSIAMTPVGGKFVMKPINTPSFASNNVLFGTSNIQGLSLRVKQWHDPDLNTSRIVVDALYGAKTLKQATVHNSSDIVPLIPLIGGVS